MSALVSKWHAAKASHQAVVAKMDKLAAILGSRDLNGQEMAQFDALKKEAVQRREEVNRIQEQLGDLVVEKRAASNDAHHFGGDRLAVFERPAGPFNDLADFAGAVRTTAIAVKRGLPQLRDQRLMPQASAPATGANEGSGSDGGILVPSMYGGELFTYAAQLAEPSLIELTSNQTLETNNFFLPRDTATPWDLTGLQAAWTGEMKAATPSKPVLAGTELRMKKVTGLAPVSNELGSDSVMTSDYLAQLFAVKIAWLIGEAILFGSGAGTPLGALNSSAAVVVPKDSGQVSNTLSATNLATMLSRLPPGSMSRARWLINPSVLPALLTLTLGNFPIYLPCRPDGRPFEEGPGGRLLGLPVIWTQHCPGFSSQGDACLVDLSYYQTITKAEGIQTATSMHLYFDADAMAFRITFRMDGAPKLTAPITPPKSSATLSPFVLLGAR